MSDMLKHLDGRISQALYGTEARATMDARAYALIEADASQVAAVVPALREVSGIRTADTITGPYDIIATIETADRRRTSGAPDHSDSDIHASFTQLLQVCTAFVATAEPSADMRNYGLTPELLAACTRALAARRGQGIPPIVSAFGEADSAAWRAYVRMLAEHGEDCT